MFSFSPVSFFCLLKLEKEFGRGDKNAWYRLSSLDILSITVPCFFRINYCKLHEMSNFKCGLDADTL